MQVISRAKAGVNLNLFSTDSYLLNQWKRARKAVLIMGFSLALFNGVFIAGYGALEGGETLALLSEQIQGMLASFLGGDAVLLTTPYAFISMGWRHPFVLVALAAFVISRGVAGVAGEIQNKTADLLFSRPVSRVSLVLQHWLVTTFGLAAICLISTAGILFWVWALGMNDPPGVLAIISTGVMAFFLFSSVAGYVYLISASASDAGLATSYSIALTLLFYLMDVLGDIWDVLEPANSYSIFYYFQPFDLLKYQEGFYPGILIYIGMSFVLLVLAIVVIKRRDLT